MRAPAMRAPWTAASPTPPAPKTATVDAGLDPRGVQHRADARGDAAADQGGAVERHVVVDLHERVLVHEHLLGVGGEVGELVDGLALPRELGRIRLGAHRPGLAEVRLAGEAVVAVPAEHRQTGDDVVARLELADLEADLLDDAGGLVAEDGGRGERIDSRPRSAGRCGRPRRPTMRTSTSRPMGLSMSTSSMVSGWCGPWNTAAFILASSVGSPGGNSARRAGSRDCAARRGLSSGVTRNQTAPESARRRRDRRDGRCS